MRKKKNFRSLDDLLRRIGDQGEREPRERETFASASDRLIHTLKIGERREILKAVSELCELIQKQRKGDL